MPRQLTKRRKTTDLEKATATAGGPAINSLPPELLETIFGFLDVGTLCTARLMCAHFHDAASRCLHSVELSVETLRSRPETTLNNFPNLSRVTVFDVKADDLALLARSPVGDAVTHLRAVSYLRQLPQRGQNAACSPPPNLPLPNLMSLTVRHAPSRPFPLPETLRELILYGSVETLRSANLVASLSNLTCLRIDVFNMHKPFKAVTALTALQKLEILCKVTLVPFIAELTLLTHLKIRDWCEWAQPSDSPVAALSRLQRLVHLEVGRLSTSQELELLASIGTISSLRSLHLHPPQGTALETVRKAPVSQLTALRLEGCDFDASIMARFNLERLQDLILWDGVKLVRDEVVALRRATGLTRLELCEAVASVAPEELGPALAHMPRLRVLCMWPTARSQASLCPAGLGLLTELTKLEWHGEGVTTNAPLEVCRGLKKLRVLSLTVDLLSLSDPITPETVLALAELPELREFRMWGGLRLWGGLFRLTENVRVRLNAERHDKGWPPLEWDIFR